MANCTFSFHTRCQSVACCTSPRISPPRTYQARGLTRIVDVCTFLTIGNTSLAFSTVNLMPVCISLSARHSLPCSAANLTCIAPGFLQQLGLQISAFHLRTYQATEPLLPGMKDQYVSVSPHNRILSPHSILSLRNSIFPLPSRPRSLLNPSSPPHRSILSFHTTADASARL